LHSPAANPLAKALRCALILTTESIEMNAGDVIEIKIERMSYGLNAVGRFSETPSSKPIVVFVPFVAPQDKVKVKLKENHKNYWTAELVDILEASPLRIKPPCPVFGKCGGCQWQHLSYEEQVRQKAEILLHQIKRVAPTYDLYEKLKIHPAKNPFHYRSRVQVHGDKNGIGFYLSGSHAIAYTNECLVLDPSLQEAWKSFNQTHSLQELSQPTGQFKVGWAKSQSGEVLEAINRKHAAFGFSQVNLEQNKILVEVVTKLAMGSKDKNLLLDLYSGSGNLSQNLNQVFKKVLCVDFNKDQSHSPTFIQQDAKEFLLGQYWKEYGPNVDCVIVDPPREGLLGVSALLLEMKAPALILVSCDPATLARDLQILQKDYQIQEIHLIDMFPQTYHIESIVFCVQN